MIPAWLERTIGDVHRAAGLKTCPRCGAPILVGLDADRAALTAHADITTVNAVGEALALLSGRPTYDLVNTGGRKELSYRDEWNISGPRKWPVLPEHRCGASLKAHVETIAPRFAYVSPNEPPF